MSILNEDFKTDVFDWFTLDDKIYKANKVIEKIKNEKDEIALEIVSFMKHKKLEKKEIKLGNNSLKCFVKTKTTPLTKKFVVGCLTEVLKDQNLAKEAGDFIYNQEKKMEACLTFFFNDSDKAKELKDYIFSRRQKKTFTNICRKKIRDVVSNDSDNPNDSGDYE
jgi:hypothetical protein